MPDLDLLDGFGLRPAEPRDADGIARLVDAGVSLSPETYEDASAYIADQLGYEIARELFGTESVVRRQAKADRQLQAALRLLRGG